MNDNWSERILDSFLDEIISGEAPPDLSDRILSQLAQRNKETNHSDIPLPEVPDDVDADRSWWQQVVHIPPVDATNSISSSISPSSLVTTSHSSLKRVDVGSSSEKKQRHLIALSLGVVACVAAIVSLAIAFPELSRSSPSIAQPNPSKTKPREGNTTKLAGSGSSSAQKEAVAPSVPKESVLPRPERLDINGLPFAVVEPDAMPNLPSENALPENEIAMSDADIVSEINGAFGELWNQYKVKPAGSIDDKEWLERTAAVLLNTTPSSSQIELFKQTDDPNKRGYLLQQATSSERFSRYFAKQLVTLLVPTEKEETAGWREEFEIWLTQNIAQRTPYNEVVYKLVTASPVRKPEVAETMSRPESYWLTELQDPHGHRVAQRVSSLWLNQSLQCSQCHDQGDAAETSQASYWAMLAALNLGDKPEYFFERKDGTLRAALAALPNGESLDLLPAENRREAFAKWLSTSPALAEGAVNMTWKLVFGAPLVSNEAAMDDPTSAARLKLLKTLAQQFRMHRYDLPRLVLWVSGSHPFATPSRVITQRDWLLASESELRDIRNSESLFANYRRLEAREVESRNVLQTIVRFEREEAGNSLRRTILAQPMPTQSLPNQNPATLSDDPLPAWQQNLRLHASADSDAVHQQLVSRLLKTKLGWAQLVQHALGRQPSPQELRWADELLQYHGGDKQATLLKLHWTTHQSL
jgi:hypothetical protein